MASENVPLTGKTPPPPGGPAARRAKNILLVFALYILGATICQALALSQFRSLPSKLYGEDYYYQMGAIRHIRNGGSPLASSSLPTGQCGYMPLYSTLCAMFCDAFNLDTLAGEFIFSLWLFLISSLVWFALGLRLFRDTFMGVVMSLLGCSLDKFPVLKYTQFSFLIILPLFFIYFYNVYERGRRRDYLALGLVMGLIALSHAVLFIATIIIFHIHVGIRLVKSSASRQTGGTKALMRGYLAWLVPALPLALLYWWKPVFVYHLRSVNDFIHWAQEDFSNARYRIAFALGQLKNFFNFSSGRTAVIAVFLAGGTLNLFFRRNNGGTKIPADFAKFLLFSSLAVMFSYFITEPLLKTNIVPGYVSYFLLEGVKIIIAAFFIHTFLKSGSRANNAEIKTRRNIARYFFVILILINILSFVNVLGADHTGSFYPGRGRKYLPPSDLATQKYIMEKTSPGDIFLSTKELSFGLNALTGRKVFANRWCHQNNPYEDFSKRDIEAAIILFGADDGERKRLLRANNIKYLYNNDRWFVSQFSPIRNGKIIDCFDPFLCLYSPQAWQILDKNKVRRVKKRYWIEPGLRGENFKQYDLLIIAPYGTISHETPPWHYDLNKYLVKVFAYQNTVTSEFAELYKIVVDK